MARNTPSSRNLFRGPVDSTVKATGQASTIAGASVTATVVMNRPPMASNAPAKGIALDVVARRADGTVARTRFEGHVTREAGTAAITWYAGTQLVGTSIAATVGAGTGTLRAAVGSVAADGSSYVVTLTNTDAANAWTFEVTER
jgi:hypothetical protein